MKTKDELARELREELLEKKRVEIKKYQSKILLLFVILSAMLSFFFLIFGLKIGYFFLVLTFTSLIGLVVFVFFGRLFADEPSVSNEEIRNYAFKKYREILKEAKESANPSFGSQERISFEKYLFDK